MVQLAPGLSDVPQLFVWLKSPFKPSAEIVSVALPLLESVIAWGVLEVPSICEAKLSEDGEKVAIAANPVPLSVIDDGAGVLLLLRVSEPLRLPIADGVKVTLIVQVAPAARDAAQLLLWLKSPLVVMPAMERGAVPLLLSVMDWAALLVLTACAAKASEAGENAVAGAVPVPVSGIEDDAGVPLLVTVSEPARLPVAVGAKVTLMVHEAPTANDAAQLLV